MGTSARHFLACRGIDLDIAQITQTNSLNTSHPSRSQSQVQVVDYSPSYSHKDVHE